MPVNLVKDSDLFPIENLIFAGVIQRSKDVFKTDAVTFISTNDRLRMAKLLEDKKSAKDFTWPQAFLHLMQLDVGMDRFHARRMAQTGTYTSTSKDESTVRNIKIIPENFTAEFIYMTDDFQQGINFAKRWTFASQLGRMNFTVTYDSVMFDIKIIQDTQINVPDKDSSAEQIGVYEYVSNMTVHGHMSDDYVTIVPMLNLTQMRLIVSNGISYQLDKTYTKNWQSPVITQVDPATPTFLTLPTEELNQ